MRCLIVAAFALLAACSAPESNEQRAERGVAPILTGADARDEMSFARPEVARVTHVALDLDADFAAKRMAGTATLDLQAADGASEIVLDSKGLEIEAVTDADSGGMAMPMPTPATPPAPPHPPPAPRPPPSVVPSRRRASPVLLRYATHDILITD